MIYDFIVDRLKQADGLGENVFPVGVNIDTIYTADNDFAFTVYTCTRRTPEYDLEGNLHHYKEEVLIDFVGRMYHSIHAMYDSTEKSFTVSDLDTGTGEYIFSSRCACPEPDAFDVDYGLLRRTMLVTIRWCPL